MLVKIRFLRCFKLSSFEKYLHIILLGMAGPSLTASGFGLPICFSCFLANFWLAALCFGVCKAYIIILKSLVSKIWII